MPSLSPAEVHLSSCSRFLSPALRFRFFLSLVFTRFKNRSLCRGERNCHNVSFSTHFGFFFHSRPYTLFRFDLTLYGAPYRCSLLWRLKILSKVLPWKKCERSSLIWLTCSQLSTNPNLVHGNMQKKNLSSPVGGISSRFSPFPSRLRHSNFAQTIPPATQAKDGLGMQIG